MNKYIVCLYYRIRMSFPLFCLFSLLSDTDRDFVQSQAIISHTLQWEILNDVAKTKMYETLLNKTFFKSVL